MRDLRVCGTRLPLLLGTCPCALVLAGGVPLWRASWPRVVRRASSGPVALGAPVSFPDAVVPFPAPGACAPGFTGWLRGARGGQPRTGLIVPAAGPRRGRRTGLAPRCTRSGPRDGVSLAGPSGVGLGLRALRWLACVDLVTDASGFPYHPSFDGGLGRCTGAVSCGRRHLPLRVGARHARVPCVCACARPSWPGQAGRPPGRVVVRLTFSSGRSVFLLCSAPSGLVSSLSWSFLCPPLVSPPLCPPPFFFFPFLRAPPLSLAFFGFRPRVPWALALCFPFPPLACGFFFLFFSAPPLSLAFSGFWPRPPWALALCVVCFVGLPLLGSPCALASFVFPAWPLAAPWWLLPPPSPPFFSVSRFSSLPLAAPFVFFSSLSLCAPVVSGFRWFPAPGALGVGAVCCLIFFWPPASRLAVPSRLFCVSRLAVGCSLVVAALPPLLRLAVFLAAARCSVFFSFFVRPRCLWLALVSGPGCPGPWRCVLFVLLASRFSAPRALSPLLCFPPGRWLLPGVCFPPPPSFLSRYFPRCRSVLRFFFPLFCCALCVV